MNDRYFSCQDCQTYIDAGYRWAYWTLEEPVIVQRALPINIESVLNAAEYWQGGEGAEEGAEWLAKLLPKVRGFLDKHRSHVITYGEMEDFFGINFEHESEWSEENADQ